jgi:hypothetical protein
MFGLFKRKPPVLRNKRVSLEIPNTLVVRYEPTTMKDHVVGKGMCVRLRDDVQAWCDANHIKVGRVYPKVIFGELALGPFALEFSNERDAIYFKTTWH